jgi:hypothetical protein
VPLHSGVVASGHLVQTSTSPFLPLIVSQNLAAKSGVGEIAWRLSSGQKRAICTLQSYAFEALQQEIDSLTYQLGPAGMLGICQLIQRG